MLPKRLWWSCRNIISIKKKVREFLNFPNPRGFWTNGNDDRKPFFLEISTFWWNWRFSSYLNSRDERSFKWDTGLSRGVVTMGLCGRSLRPGPPLRVRYARGNLRGEPWGVGLRLLGNFKITSAMIQNYLKIFQIILNGLFCWEFTQFLYPTFRFLFGFAGNKIGPRRCYQKQIWTLDKKIE